MLSLHLLEFLSSVGLLPCTLKIIWTSPWMQIKKFWKAIIGHMAYVDDSVACEGLGSLVSRFTTFEYLSHTNVNRIGIKDTPIFWPNVLLSSMLITCFLCCNWRPCMIVSKFFSYGMCLLVSTCIHGNAHVEGECCWVQVACVRLCGGMSCVCCQLHSKTLWAFI